MASEGEPRPLTLAALQGQFLTEHQPLAIDHNNQIIHLQASYSCRAAHINTVDEGGFGEREAVARSHAPTQAQQPPWMKGMQVGQQ